MYVVWRNPRRWCLCGCQRGCVCEPVLLWCHRAVAGPLCRPELCEAASPSPSLSGPALRALPRTGAPSSYLSCSLNCGPQCRDPATFSNNREINSAPPIALSASHPANEGAAWGLFTRVSNQKLSAKENTHSHTQTHTHYSSHDINDSQWQQHTLCGGTHCKHTHFFHSESWSRHQLFSPRQQQRCWLPVAAVGMAMAARKGDLRFEGCPGTRQSREGERERLGGGGRGRTHLRTPSSLVVTRGRGRWRRGARSKFGAQIKPKQTPINMTDAVTWAASMQRLVSLNKPV